MNRQKSDCSQARFLMIHLIGRMPDIEETRSVFELALRNPNKTCHFRESFLPKTVRSFFDEQTGN